MKVLVVTNMYPTKDRPYFGIFVARQVEALRREGVDIIVEVIAGDRGESDYLFARRRVARLVRSEMPDVIHCHYGYTPLAVAFLGTPYLVTLCGDDVNGESDGKGGITFKSRLGVVVSQVLALGAARVLAKSEGMRTRLWPWSRAKADLLPNGVDDALFFPLAQDVARERLGIASDVIVLGFVNSRRQRTKRLDLAEATRAALARRGRRVQLLIAQDVPPAEMPWYYCASDCVLMTSDLEGSPNSVKEALACGVPVVGVPVGNVPELIDTAERGRIAPRDPERLADAVEEVLNSRSSTRHSLLPEALRASSVARRLIGIYQRICVRPEVGRHVPAD
jgi:glycosyltransferase involved in cell wall biosynthesis